MKLIFCMLMVSIVILSLLVAGCCGATGSVSAQSGAAAPTTSPQAASSPSSPQNIEDAKVGTTYQVDYMNSKYEVTLVQTAFADSDNPYVKGGHYLMAYFEIKNIGSTSEYFGPSIYALDSTGEKYDTTIPFGLSSDYAKTLSFIKELPPNTKTSGWAAIDVPQGASSLDLYFEYTNSFLSKTPNYIKYKVSG